MSTDISLVRSSSSSSSLQQHQLLLLSEDLASCLLKVIILRALSVHFTLRLGRGSIMEARVLRRLRSFTGTRMRAEEGGITIWFCAYRSYTLLMLWLGSECSD